LLEIIFSKANIVISKYKPMIGQQRIELQSSPGAPKAAPEWPSFNILLRNKSCREEKLP
jgi:hypothetical protein